jgi:hypothetical protein
MKKILFLLPFLLALSPAFAGADTIYVNTTRSSYIVFDQDVVIVDCGVKNDYAVQAEKNVVFIKALKEPSQETTLFVSAGKKVYAGIVKFCKTNNQFLYDLRDKTLNVAASYSRDNYVPQVDIALTRERLFSLKEAPRKISNVGVTKNGCTWSLTNLKTDNSSIYLKLRLENNSALVYRVESISVENAEFYKKRILSRKKTNKIPVVPQIEGNIVDVKPYSTHDYFLAIPVYAVGKQGAVYVTIREVSGVRSSQIEIPYSTMEKADLF